MRQRIEEEPRTNQQAPLLTCFFWGDEQSKSNISNIRIERNFNLAENEVLVREAFWLLKKWFLKKKLFKTDSSYFDAHLQQKSEININTVLMHAYNSHMSLD